MAINNPPSLSPRSLQVSNLTLSLLLPRVTMPSTATTFPLLLLLLLLSLTAAVTAESTSAACKSSFYPKLCRAVLAPIKLRSDPYDYGRYSVKAALKQATRTANLIESYLSKPRPRGGPQVGRGALDDCAQLEALNADFLAVVQAELGPKGTVLDRSRVDRVRALMSALVTNQQTCYDGLEASRTFPELYGAFSNETKLYGVSLELVTSALDRTGGGPAGSVSEFHGSEFGRHLLEGDIPISQWVTVAQDGSGNFSTIGDAVQFVPNGTTIDNGYITIYIGPGVYQENVVVAKNKKNLVMIGAGIDRTVITGNRSFGDGWTTYNSATFAVHGERFIAINITFENTAGPEKHQAVAVRNSADLSIFYRCKFTGYQDTLYAHSLRQFYRDCEIYGTVDFIFGNAASVFQHCNIYARKPLPSQFNAITAQGRLHPNQTTGISIHNCTISAASDLRADPGSTRTYLGRPWKEYSRTVYMQSYLDDLIDPAGWVEWNGTTFALETLFYGEFRNYGPGANISERVQWPGYSLMNETQASDFTVYNFTLGQEWLPAIPHDGGLL